MLMCRIYRNAESREKCLGYLEARTRVVSLFQAEMTLSKVCERIHEEGIVITLRYRLTVFYFVICNIF